MANQRDIEASSASAQIHDPITRGMNPTPREEQESNQPRAEHPPEGDEVRPYQENAEQLQDRGPEGAPVGAPGHFDALEGIEGEQAVDTYEGQDHKRGPAPPPRPIFQSESTQLMEELDTR